MFTNNRELGYDVTEILAPTLFEPTSDEIQEVQDSGNALLLGSTLRTATAFGRTATVKPGEDIRPALNSLKSAGGGTLILLAGTHRPTYHLIGDSKINIVGEGVDLTIIDFNGAAYGVLYFGTTDEPVRNFKISNFTIQNSNYTSGVFIQYCRDFEVSNVTVTSCDQDGLGIYFAKNFRFNNVVSTSNTSDGFYLTGNKQNVNENTTSFFSFVDCIADSNGANGFLFQPDDSSAINNFSITNCISIDNTGDGFEFDDNGGSCIDYTLTGCNAQTNGGHGFFIESGNGRGVLLGCQSDTNTGNGYDIACDRHKFIGCFAAQNAIDWNINPVPFFGTLKHNVFIGCEISRGVTTTPTVEYVEDDTATHSIGTIGGNLTTDKEIAQMENNSGSTLGLGDVVVLDADAVGDSVTTTTTVGDDKVVGMYLTTATNGQHRPILTLGKTTSLKVNGTTDIAVGDFLATYSVAGIAAKAAAGDMAFAIALEAYTTDDSNGVIDALLIKPRKI